MSNDKSWLWVRTRFHALHQLSSPALSASENESVFGKCCHLHGHTYILSVAVSGPWDAQAGWIHERPKLLILLESQIQQPFNGQFLNDFFRWTTGEWLAQEFYQLCQSRLGLYEVEGVILQETRKNRFYCGSARFYNLT